MLFQLIFECFFTWSFYVRVKINILSLTFGWCNWFQNVEKNISGKTLNENCKTLKDIEKGLSNKDDSKTYAAPPDINSTWIKNKEKYFEALEDNCSSKKWKLRESDFEKLENVVFRWLFPKRSQNIPIDGNIIKGKAISYPKELGYSNFHSSAGWLDRWKKKGKWLTTMFIWRYIIYFLKLKCLLQNTNKLLSANKVQCA